MTYFVMAHKRDGIMENVRIGGYKNESQAMKRFRKYATAEVKVYTSKGLVTKAIRVNGKEHIIQ